MSLIEKLKANRAALRKEFTLVGETVVVDALTTGENMTANAKHPNDRALYFAELLVTQCRTKDGTPAFTANDKPVLAYEVAFNDVQPIVNWLLGVSVEEQKKN